MRNPESVRYLVHTDEHLIRVERLGEERELLSGWPRTTYQLYRGAETTTKEADDTRSGRIDHYEYVSIKYDLPSEYDKHIFLIGKADKNRIAFCRYDDGGRFSCIREGTSK